MSERQPLDFLIGRAALMAKRAAELAQKNSERREQSVQARRHAQIAVLKARLLSQYAVNLCELSHTLNRQFSARDTVVPKHEPGVTNELQRRRIEQRLRHRRGG